jgi:phosphatidylglycerophosphatase GEP4
MSGFNLSATLNVLRLAFNPQMCMPHLVVSTFNEIPVPVNISGSEKKIKAIVLDKDNCFAKAHDDKVWPDYAEKWKELRNAYPGASLLIVSNSAGTNDDRNDHEQAQILEQRTGVSVLRHTTKKPGCHEEIMQYFREHNVCEDPAQVAVVGDRLFTDMLMANMMGARGVWVSTGVVLSMSPICRAERWWYSVLKQ